MQIRKEEIRLQVFANEMRVYVSNLKESARFLKLISEFSNITIYKINIQKKSLYFHVLTIDT